MSTIRRKTSRKTSDSPEKSAVLTDPRHNLDGFDVTAAIKDIETAVTDAGPFFSRMERNEMTRKAHWAGRNESGRKKDTPQKKAGPWDGAADHQVHLAQEVLLQLTAQRTAAMMRGNLSVTPMEGTDAKTAGLMKLVMRYYLETAMRGERLIQGSRWASWALRQGHAVLYIGWKTVKALEKREVTEQELIEYQMANQIRQMQDAGIAIDPVMDETLRANAEVQVQSLATEDELAAILIEMRPDLKERQKEAMNEAKRCIRTLRASPASLDRKGYYFSAYIKESRPVWEAKRPGVDFFAPPETMHQDSFDEARWLLSVRWLSAQQILEEAAQRDWDPDWVNEVIAKCKGKSRMLTTHTSASPWALCGLGVGWASSDSQDIDRNLYQIFEYYDRKVTSDGVQCTYQTVLHPDITNRVAKRELIEDWHGHYPFVPATNEQDEPLLMANRGVPEICFSPQNTIKTQWDARDDMAALTTSPPWTGPEDMASIAKNRAPGSYIPEWRSGSVAPAKMPPPDNRSIEIESTVRASVDRYFGLMSKAVPEQLAMLLSQTGVDWFLLSYSRAVGLTSQLVQQRMSRLTGARITGTDLVFNADREQVRGNFDFRVHFDVRALDIEWTKSILEFVNNILLPMDNRGLINRRPIIELGFNMIAPNLTDSVVQEDDAANKTEISDEQAQLNSIFSGGVPEFITGVDHSGRAQEMQRDLSQSPVRQSILASNPNIAAVWEDRLQKHLHQTMQQGDNKLAGIQGGGDPLKQSPMARLKAEGWQGAIQQTAPQPMS
jgi:hypothetical protein